MLCEYIASELALAARIVNESLAVSQISFQFVCFWAPSPSSKVCIHHTESATTQTSRGHSRRQGPA